MTELLKPRTENSPEIKLTGMKKVMSFSKDFTQELWEAFMPRNKEIANKLDTCLYSVEIYDSPAFFDDFKPDKDFEKWAAVQVNDFDTVLEGMETLTVPAGLYAVFIQKGNEENSADTYQFIFETWLPKSEFVLDDRPHFALMGESYIQGDPDAEEEIWIPIKEKNVKQPDLTVA